MKINLKHSQFNYILTKDYSYANNSGHLQTFHSVSTIEKLLSDLIKLPENNQLLRKHSFDLVQAHSIKNLSDAQYIHHIAYKILYKKAFLLKLPADKKDNGNGSGNGDGKKSNKVLPRTKQTSSSDRIYAPATHPLYNVNHAVRTPPEIYRPFVCAFDPPPTIEPEKEELRIIDVKYLDCENNPIPGATYQIESLNVNGVPDGRFKANGTTDDQGTGHIDGVSLDIISIKYSFYDDPQPYQIDSKFKPQETPDTEETKSTFDAIIDWILGTAQGDFNKEQSMSQIAVNAVLGLIPLVDQALDLRDIIAGLKDIIQYYSDDEVRQNDKSIYPDTFGLSFEMWMWVNVFIIAIGCIPELGSAVKGVLKSIIEFCQKNLEKATDVINAKNAKLLWEQIIRILNYFGKGGNAHRWLKELPDLLTSKMDDAALKIRGCLDAIQDLLVKAQEYANTQIGQLLIGNERAAELTQHITKIKKAIGTAYKRLDEMKGKVNEWLREKIMELLGGKHEPALVGATGHVGSPHVNVHMQELEEPPSGNFKPNNADSSIENLDNPINKRTDDLFSANDKTESLNEIRKKYSLSENPTIGVAKSDIPGIEGVTFAGLSPSLRREAGLPQLDEIAPDRPIKSPFKNSAFTRHAEEDILNQVDKKISDLGLTDTDLKGKTLEMHIANPRGVCNKCAYGLQSDTSKPGVLVQFSQRHPTLNLKITTEGGSTLPGHKELLIKNGQIISE